MDRAPRDRGRGTGACRDGGLVGNVVVKRSGKAQEFARRSGDGARPGAGGACAIDRRHLLPAQSGSDIVGSSDHRIAGDRLVVVGRDAGTGSSSAHRRHQDRGWRTAGQGGSEIAGGRQAGRRPRRGEIASLFAEHSRVGSSQDREHPRHRPCAYAAAGTGSDEGDTDRDKDCDSRAVIGRREDGGGSGCENHPTGRDSAGGGETQGQSGRRQAVAGTGIGDRVAGGAEGIAEAGQPAGGRGNAGSADPDGSRPTPHGGGPPASQGRQRYRR